MDTSFVRSSTNDPVLAESHIDDLQKRLSEIERRLGTAAEQPGDMQAARDCAHDISNIRMRLAMLLELARHKKRRAQQCEP